MKKISLSQPFQILFIIFVCLGVFYPSLFGEVTSIDDHRLITNLYNAKEIDITTLFFRKSSGNYYRPLLYSTYLLEKKFLGLHEFFMHFNNVLLHTMSVIMVFFLIKNFLKYFSKESNETYIPFFISLLFALHPINTESVNWISGRTDVLASLFVFISLYMLFKSELKKKLWILGAGFFYLLGLLSKEVAIGLFPVVIILLFIRNHRKDMSLSEKIYSIGVFVFFTVLYFYMRSGFVLEHDSGLKNVITAGRDNPSFWISLRGIIKATGFYLKKLFLPLPLNFAIVNVSTKTYLTLGILTTLSFVVCNILLIFKKHFNEKLLFLSFWFIFSVIFYIPALPLVLAKITWTPLAERYLYISSLGSAFIVVYYLATRLKERWFFISISVILILCGFITVERNIIWQKNITLWADTVKKSPDFAPARNDYAIALIKEGRIEEAKKQLKLASKLANDRSANPDINLAILESPYNLDNAERIVTQQINNPELKEKFKIRALEKFISIKTSKLLDEKIPEEKKKKIYRELISGYNTLFTFRQDGFYKYRIGQLYIALGEKRKALENFKEAARLSPNEYFSPAARKLVKKLEAELADKAGES